MGAGPGDPDLLTFRALRLMQKADVVLHDALVSDAIMNLVRKDAQRIYVGKKSNNHTLPQQDINALMVQLAREGKRVLRIKGGDPFIFGRGGEEVEHLQSAGIAVGVVNGITSGLAALTSLGVSLTHREHAQGVIFVTGHVGSGTASTDWEALATTAHSARLTLVIYMGVAHAHHIQDGLLGGLPADTPVAAIQNATLRSQRHAVCTLANLQRTIEQDEIASPSVIVVGDVLRGLAAAQIPIPAARRSA